MKIKLAVISLMLLSACSIEVKKEIKLGFTEEELNQAICLGSYKTVNGVYVTPEIESLSTEVKKAYYKCMDLKSKK